MITIECVAFLGGEPNIRPKVLTADDQVYVWGATGHWYQMAWADKHDFNRWAKHAADGRLIIRGKLRIKV